MLAEPGRNILIGPLLQTAVARCWAARDHLLRLGLVPLAVLLMIMVPLARTIETLQDGAVAGIENPGLMPRGILLLLAYAAVVAVFSVNWLRQLTLGSAAVPGIGLALNGRHLRFFLALVAIAIAAMVPVMLVSSLFAIVLQGEGALFAGAALGFLAWASLTARLSPSWIGIAIDVPMALGVAWKRTAGQGFKIVVAMLAVQVALMLAQEVVTAVFELTGLATVAPMTYFLVSAAVNLIGFAMQLSVLAAALPHFLRETV
jgi:hypothetical protein